MEAKDTSPLYDVLRYLLDRVPHSTQDDYDRVAAAIDELENPAELVDELDDTAAADQTTATGPTRGKQKKETSS
jgi:hypothetical protein